MDVLFYIGVFLTAIYFINVNNLNIKIVGWIIFIAHIYQLLMKLEKWPLWCEYIGICLAVILINEGNNIENHYSFLIGWLKLIAHLRQLILKDNRYYY
tara:strand:- start:1502 stop:1795 length:294 start_codon:yes stop_codon:yes gene_type:complete